MFTAAFHGNVERMRELADGIAKLHDLCRSILIEHAEPND